MLGAEDGRPDRIEIDSDRARCRCHGAVLGAVALLRSRHVPQFPSGMPSTPAAACSSASAPETTRPVSAAFMKVPRLALLRSSDALARFRVQVAGFAFGIVKRNVFADDRGTVPQFQGFRTHLGAPALRLGLRPCAHRPRALRSRRDVPGLSIDAARFFCDSVMSWSYHL